jgi:hypothetical protein
MVVNLLYYKPIGYYHKKNLIANLVILPDYFAGDFLMNISRDIFLGGYGFYK